MLRTETEILAQVSEIVEYLKKRVKIDTVHLKKRTT